MSGARVQAELTSALPASAAPRHPRIEVAAAEQRSKLPYVVGGLAVLLAAAGLAFWYRYASPEASILRAIEEGRLVTPEGTSAYDLYLQVKAGGLSDSARSGLRKKTVPRLTAAGESLFQKRTQGNTLDQSELKRLVRLYEWAAELAPDDSKILSRYSCAQGSAAYAQEKYADALQFFRRCADQDEGWALPFNDLGRTYVKLSNDRLAEESYTRAIQVDPTWVYPQVNLGGIYFHRKEWDSAERAYLQATQTDGTYATAWYFLGQVYEAQDRVPDAIMAYEKAVELAATRPSTAFNVNPVQRHIAALRTRLPAAE